MGEEREFENKVVLWFVQALIGAITDGMVALAIATSTDDVSVDFYVAQSDVLPSDLELIQEVVDDIDTLSDGKVLVRSHVWIGGDWTSGWPGRGHRVIFAKNLGGYPS